MDCKKNMYYFYVIIILLLSINALINIIFFKSTYKFRILPDFYVFDCGRVNQYEYTVV